MVLKVQEAPSGWEEALSRDLDLVLEGSASPDSHSVEVVIDALKPIPVYEIDTKSGQEAGLGTAELKAWRSFVFDGETKVAIDLVPAEDSRLKVLRTRRGRVPSEALRILEKARGEAESQEGDYEVRFLEVPNLFWGLVWLSSQGEKADEMEDKFFPMFPTTRLKVDAYHRGKDFDLLLKEASRDLESSQGTALVAPETVPEASEEFHRKE